MTRSRSVSRRRRRPSDHKTRRRCELQSAIVQAAELKPLQTPRCIEVPKQRTSVRENCERIESTKQPCNSGNQSNPWTRPGPGKNDGPALTDPFAVSSATRTNQGACCTKRRCSCRRRRGVTTSTPSPCHAARSANARARTIQLNGGPARTRGSWLRN